jgi:hypothetical protein
MPRSNQLSYITMIRFLIFPTIAIGAAIFHLPVLIVNCKFTRNECRVIHLSAGFCEI